MGIIECSKDQLYNVRFWIGERRSGDKRNKDSLSLDASQIEIRNTPLGYIPKLQTLKDRVRECVTTEEERLTFGKVQKIRITLQPFIYVLKKIRQLEQ